MTGSHVLTSKGIAMVELLAIVTHANTAECLRAKCRPLDKLCTTAHCPGHCLAVVLRPRCRLLQIWHLCHIWHVCVGRSGGQHQANQMCCAMLGAQYINDGRMLLALVNIAASANPCMHHNRSCGEIPRRKGYPPPFLHEAS